MLAVKILNKASEIVSKRSARHGDVVDSFHMIADLWTAYLRNRLHLTSGELLITPADVCNMLVHLKQARIVAGDERIAENYIDGAGYMGLCAQLSGVQLEEEE